jgi:hypothetical protein
VERTGALAEGAATADTTSGVRVSAARSESVEHEKEANKRHESGSALTRLLIW